MGGGVASTGDELVYVSCLDAISNAFLPSSNINPKVSNMKNNNITTNPYTPFI